ncbi:MAG: glutamine-hydrolyzing GMP synthase, partial [Rhodospirillales bacterium]|nr:glutamine-hydrolyzing GMP synthase [Rhodospirillales bacterium]
MNHQKILILDFGSQVTQLIARRVRESGVYCEILPFNADVQRMRDFGAAGIILSGGPASVADEGSPRAPDWVFSSGLPVLGICYGQMAMCVQLGGAAKGAEIREFGRAHIEVVADCELFDGTWSVGAREQVWMSHGDHISAPPPGFKTVAVSEGAPYALIANDERKYYGMMFHPEVVHTPHGAQLLKNFTHKVCGLSGDWTMASFRHAEIEKIRAQVGKGRVICGLSGGVDSSVAAALIHEAIGDQLTCIFVDHGLLRAGEADEVVKVFRDQFNIKLIHRDASDLFLGELKGVTDPEAKRKIIGKLFIDVFDEEATKLGGAEFLAQGTLYPDVIESVSALGGPSVTIKSHHNVGGLPDYMTLKLVEPLRELFKDEVRALGRELGLPET